jgi:hypothetical protein
MMKTVRTCIRASMVCLAVALSPIAFAQQDVKHHADKTAHHDNDVSSGRPKLTLNADRNVGLSPTKITLTAHLSGGANADHEFDCPTVEWDWGDGTQSASSSTCRPDQLRQTEIQRHFTVEHVFEQGQYHVQVRLLARGKVMASAGTDIMISGDDDPVLMDDREGGIGQPTGAPGFDVTLGRPVFPQR